MATTLDGPILITGVGSIGRRHLKNLRSLGQDDFVLYRTGKGPPLQDDRNTSTDPPWIRELPTVASLEEALERSPVAAVVSNPTSLHVETALAAARAGAHLLVEKPLSHSMAGVEELRRAVEERSLVLLVGYQFRFHPTLRAIRKVIRSGALGRIVSARAWWGEHLPEWHPGEVYARSYAARRDLGGGAILTLSHPIDYMCWILGPVASVQCHAGRVSELHVEVEDVADLTLRFGGGPMGNLHLDYLRRPPDHGLEVVGTGGTVTWNGHSGVAKRYDPEAQDWIHKEPPPGFERNDLFLSEARHFLRCISGDEEPRCTLEDGVRALRVALAALESARREQSVSV